MSVAGFPLPSETQSKLCARKFLMETQKCQKTSWNSADIFRLSWYFLRRVYRSNFSKVSFFKIFHVPTLVWRSLHHPHAMTAGLTEDWRGTEGTGALFWAARRGARGTHLSAERSSTVLWLMGKRWGPGLPLDRPPKPFQVDERLTALGWGPPWGAIRHPRTDWGSTHPFPSLKFHALSKSRENISWGFMRSCGMGRYENYASEAKHSSGNTYKFIEIEEMSLLFCENFDRHRQNVNTEMLSKVNNAAIGQRWPRFGKA